MRLSFCSFSSFIPMLPMPNVSFSWDKLYIPIWISSLSLYTRCSMLCTHCAMNIYAYIQTYSKFELKINSWNHMQIVIYCIYIGLDWIELNWMCNPCVNLVDIIILRPKFYADNLIEPSNDCWYGSFWLNFNFTGLENQNKKKINKNRDKDTCRRMEIEKEIELKSRNDEGL